MMNKIAGNSELKLQYGGECFQRAYKLRDKLGHQAYLVHAMVQGSIGPVHSHAWVEMGDNVYDDSLGKLTTLPKVLYYKFGKVKDVYRYNRIQVLDKVLKFMHYGPWEGAEAEPPIKD